MRTSVCLEGERERSILRQTTGFEHRLTPLCPENTQIARCTQCSLTAFLYRQHCAHIFQRKLKVRRHSDGQFLTRIRREDAKKISATGDGKS